MEAGEKAPPWGRRGEEAVGRMARGRARHYCVSGVIGMNSHCHVSRQCLWSRGPYHDLCV